MIKNSLEFGRGLSRTMTGKIGIPAQEGGRQTICVRQFVWFSTLKDFNRFLKGTRLKQSLSDFNSCAHSSEGWVFECFQKWLGAH